MAVSLLVPASVVLGRCFSQGFVSGAVAAFLFDLSMVKGLRRSKALLRRCW